MFISDLKSYGALILVWTSSAAGAKDDGAQRPLKPGDRAKYQAACPDYTQYSKYALQLVKCCKSVALNFELISIIF